MIYLSSTFFPSDCFSFSHYSSFEHYTEIIMSVIQGYHKVPEGRIYPSFSLPHYDLSVFWFGVIQIISLFLSSIFGFYDSILLFLYNRSHVPLIINYGVF
jgi:hypothetical protein